MADEIMVGMGEEGSLTGVQTAKCSVVSPVLRLPVDPGHVTDLVVTRRDWVFRPRLFRSSFSPHIGGTVLGSACH